MRGWIGIEVDRVSDKELESHIREAWQLIAPAKSRQLLTPKLDSRKPPSAKQRSKLQESMMYCHACGIALSQPTKYCNRCGVQLINQDPTGEVKRTEKRLDEYLDGLFWITVFGVGLIFGGMVVMKKVGLSDFFIFAYLLISSTAFLINFLINLAAARRIGRKSHDLPGADERQTGQLGAATPEMLPPPASVVRDHTTRSFEPVYAKRKTE